MIRKSLFISLVIVLFSSWNLHAFVKDFGEDAPDYSKYGEFKNIGTDKYEYVLTKKKDLAKVQGEGIYPNSTSILKNPGFLKARKEGKLDGSIWDFIGIDDDALAFYKWASTKKERPSIIQFYVGMILEKAGYIKHAIKAYYTTFICFPKITSNTYWGSPWYVAEVALDRAKFLCRKYPELGLKIDGARLEIENRFDNDLLNDIYHVWPGKLVKEEATKTSGKTKLEGMDSLKSQHEIDKKKVFGDLSLIKYKAGDWQLLVKGNPYIIKGVAYMPTVIGQSPNKGTFQDWMTSDIDDNGKIDNAYDVWVDKNNNDKQDADEPAVGDFKIMKDMGVNTIRLYHHASNKELLKDMYDKYGIRVMIGDYIGMYAVGSNAGWYEGTDYTNEEHQANMLASVEAMVNKHKDEPYVLMWILGNENNYGKVGIPNKFSGSSCRAGEQPEAYFKFVEKAARRIKEIDPNHPVVVCNGDLLFLDIFAKECPSVDVFGCNIYRGSDGFGDSFWDSVKRYADIPVIITEYGCPAFYWGKDLETAESFQKIYHKNAWEDIVYNNFESGRGNSIGGVIFEWVDEWWKAYFPYYHDRIGQWAGPFPDGWMYEEWLGVCSQGSGKNSPFQRNLRQTYDYYKSVWKDN